MLRTDDGQTIRLEDYRPTDFAVHHVDMLVRLRDGAAEIRADIRLERREGVALSAPLVLDGDELVLTGLWLDGEPVAPERFDATPERLVLRDLPARGPFGLRIETRLSPPWTTDWIAPAAAEKLRAHGIAPPGPAAHDVARPLRFAPPIACPRCRSQRTERLSEFGSTACKALYRCVECREPFEYLKPI